MKSFQLLASVFLSSVMLVGCGSETEPNSTSEEATATADSTSDKPKRAPSTATGPRARQLEQEMWHFAGLDSVAWVRFEEEGVYIGMMDEDLNTDKEEIFKSATEALANVQGEFSLWIVDSSTATEDWAQGDDGLLHKISLPIKVNFER